MKKLKIFLFTALISTLSTLFVLGINAKVQAKEIKMWEKVFGGAEDDEAYSIIQTKDGGFAVVGYTDSKGKGSRDAWIFKLDKNGNLIWDKTFGGAKWDEVKSIVQTRDGGFVVAGYTESKSKDRVPGNAWVFKIDKDGNLIWDKAFGGKELDTANSIIQTKDGNYVVAGHTWSKGAGKSDAWIFKLDKNGNLIWDKTFGGSEVDFTTSIIQTKDGGFVVVGDTSPKGNADAWIFKIDKDGNLIWNKTFGNQYYDDSVNSIIQTRDEGFVGAGYTYSKSNKSNDAWVFKIDKNGNLIADKVFGGKFNDKVYSIVQTKDRGFAVAGFTWSKGHGNENAWVFKLNKYGDLVWDKTFGGENLDGAYSIVQTKDGGFVVVGYTKSKGNGNKDVWIFKIDKDGNLKIEW